MKSKYNRSIIMKSIFLKGFIFGLMLSVYSNLMAHEDTNAISLAKASELSLHRLEKLVNLRSVVDGIKIDKTFISNLHTVEIKKTPHGPNDEISFITTLSQFLAEDGTKPEIELSLNSMGKTLVQHARNGSIATNAPTWPQKSPVDLMENGLHYVIDNALVNIDLKPFNEGVYKTTLTKTVVNGKEVAKLELLSTIVPTSLIITLDLEARFLGYEIK